ncbi:hypothetical protein Q0A17_20640 [Citrobacter sp. S2-9]|uniref:cGAS/DncV-like nucleotidyltransferase C-terminal helical domain-containing protein n=1 Tax=Citrobacter enshiensis TaxID=2971264 RepID=A0ABT8PZE6_9ENTR|nr:hypothetical protein [Citrobacter enshiensis]MDN8601796.1 hypothetical protein [Citrobacter enshiensis]
MPNSSYKTRIERMKSRRKGSLDQKHVATESISNPRYDGLEHYALLENALDLPENWESRGASDSATRYVIGAMQPVDSRYTQISLETAGRIQNQLNKKLTQSLEFRVQGSVPLDIHIKGFSDVDLLIIDQQMLMYALKGIGSYRPSEKDSRDVIIALREAACDALKSAFPAAHVDDNNNKSLRITGGSLQREVDVVPSIWWDTVEYQMTKSEDDRGVTIINKSTREHIYNAPFLHIKRIKDKCDQCNGGLRKSIRLLKTLKADSKEEGKDINLSSYDIASLMFHADADNLRHNAFYELAVLVETHRWLNYLCQNPDNAKQLDVPNETRKILEKPESFTALLELTGIVNSVVTEVLRETTGIPDEFYSYKMSDVLKNKVVY